MQGWRPTWFAWDSPSRSYVIINSATFHSQKFHGLDQSYAKYVSFSATFSFIYSYNVLFSGNRAKTLLKIKSL